MNQILNYKNKHINKIKFKYVFTFIIFILILLFIYIFYQNYKIMKKNNFSQKIVDRFEISKLYTNSNAYTASFINSPSSLKINDNNGNSDIIGTIKIDKLNLNYPILYSYSDELLEIAPCRISGPLPNEIGNLCIAAHNYNNSTFFSQISSLEIGDRINVSNSYGNDLDYFVYTNYETNFDDLSCIEQNYKKEITLITCNNINQNKRIIIKAKN